MTTTPCTRCASPTDCAARGCAATLSGPTTAKVGDVVMFRPGRMYGYPERAAEKAMVTAVRPNGRVDLEIGCEGLSQVSGEARSVPNINDLPQSQREQLACWWAA